MSDPCIIAGAAGRRGSGKTTLLKQLAAKHRRRLFWDWRGEYDGDVVTLDKLPALFKRTTFAARYRPGRYNLVHEFDALAYVVGELGEDLCLVVDEAALVTPNYQEGGLGRLLRYSRPQRIHLLWATQRLCRIPGVLISEANVLHLFHLHHRADQMALGAYVDEAIVQRVAALPPHSYLTVRF